jgi:tetratricopeptide (TPR) repeat protein
MADRFVYLPQIGLCVVVVWCAAEATRINNWGRPNATAAAALVLAALTACAWRQTTFWRDSESLWDHTLACTDRNVAAHHNLGMALAKRGKFDDAIVQYREALLLKSDMFEAHNNLGYALSRTGKLDDSIAEYEKALDIEQKNAGVHYNLARALAERGKIDAAVEQYNAALNLKPDYAQAHASLAKLLVVRGQLIDAIAHCETALKNDPECAEACGNYGYALVSFGRAKEAVRQLEKAVSLDPDYAEALNNLAWVRSTNPDETVRDGAEAVRLALRAAKLTPNRPDAFDTLAAAYAENRQFDKAVATARQGLEQARKDNDRASIEGIESRLKLYESGKPYREAR